MVSFAKHALGPEQRETRSVGIRRQGLSPSPRSPRWPLPATAERLVGPPLARRLGRASRTTQSATVERRRADPPHENLGRSPWRFAVNSLSTLRRRTTANTGLQRPTTRC